MCLVLLSFSSLNICSFLVFLGISFLFFSSQVIKSGNFTSLPKWSIFGCLRWGSSGFLYLSCPPNPKALASSSFAKGWGFKLFPTLLPFFLLSFSLLFLYFFPFYLDSNVEEEREKVVCNIDSYFFKVTVFNTSLHVSWARCQHMCR